MEKRGNSKLMRPTTSENQCSCGAGRVVWISPCDIAIVINLEVDLGGSFAILLILNLFFSRFFFSHGVSMCFLEVMQDQPKQVFLLSGELEPTSEEL